MEKVKELKIYFQDDSMSTLMGEDANNAVIQLFRYSNTGYPLFIELGKNMVCAAGQVTIFHFVKEEVE